MSSGIKRIVLNSVSGVGTVVVRGAVAVALVPFLIAHLGAEAYGVVCLISAIVGISMLADLGLRQALGRELSELIAREDYDGYGKMFSTAALIYTVIGFVLAAVCVLSAGQIVQFFSVSEGVYGQAVQLVRFYGSFAVLASFLVPVWSSVLVSFDRFDLVGYLQSGRDVISALGLVLVLPSAREPLVAWSYVMVLGAVGGLLFLVLQARRVAPRLRFSFASVDSGCLKGLFGLGGYIYLLQLTSLFSANADPLVISRFLGPSGVAAYQPSANVSVICRSLVLTVANQMYPLATRSHIGGESGKTRAILLEGTRFTMLVGSLFSAGLIVWAGEFCRLWLGGSLGGDYMVAANVLIGWAIADYLTYAGGTQWAVLLGMKRLRFLVFSQLPLAILNVGLSIYFVGYLGLGVASVLYATIGIGLVRRPVLIWYTARVCDVRFRDYVAVSYVKPFGCFLCVLCFSLGLRSWVAGDLGWIGLVLCCCFSGVVWLVVVWAWALGRDDRKFVLRQIGLG